MNNPIETAPATTVDPTTTTTNGNSDPDPGCCTAPPDGDPGPIKG
jgi:hypothetical protein